MNEIRYHQEVDKWVSYDVRAVRAVKRIVHERLKVQPGEQVLIVGDYSTEEEMIEAFATVVAEAGAVPAILTVPNSGWDTNPQAFPPMVEKAILNSEADVVIGLERTYFATSFALALSMGGALAELFSGKPAKGKTRCIFTSSSWKYFGVYDIDKEEMEKYYDAARRIGRIIGTGKKIRLTGYAGTDLTAEIYGGGFETYNYLQSLKNPNGVKPLDWLWEGGIVTGCEVDVAPRAGTAEGILVWDGPICSVRSHGESIKCIVKKGRIVSVEGGKDAIVLRKLLAEVKNLDQIVELAAGLTPGWKPDGNVHGEKRGLGNVHATIGEWLPHLVSPGHVKLDPAYWHLDGTIYAGTMEIDGKKVISEGEILV